MFSRLQRFYRYFGFVITALFFVNFCAAQITGITGQTSCATAGVQYQYTVIGSYPGGTTMQWCATGGTIQGGGSCRTGSPLPTVFVTWTAGTGRQLSLSSGSGSPTINVTVVGSLSGGTITSGKTQTVAYGATPAPINCGNASGGACSATYSYQWQKSTDGVNYADTVGATGLNVTLPTLGVTTYYRRKVTETSSSSIAYSDVATITVTPPPIIPGVTSPTYQMTNRLKQAPMTIVSAPASIITCNGEGCFTYQWQQSTNGTTWSNISNATGLFYNPGQYNPGVKTYYRLQITNGTQSVYGAVDTIESKYSPINGAVDVWVGQTVTYSYTGGAQPGNYDWYYGPSLFFADTLSSSKQVGNYTLKWKYPGTAVVYLKDNPSGTWVYDTVYIHQIPINAGTIGKSIVNLETGSPTTFYCYAAIGGSCIGNFTYQWQISTDSTTYTNISGQVGLDLTTTPIQNAYYRRVVYCSGTPYYSDTSHVLLYPYFSPGTIALGSSDSSAWGGVPSLMSGTKATGGVDTNYLYQWEYSYDAVNFKEVSNDAQGVSFQSNNLFNSTYFRRKVTNGYVTRYTDTVLQTVKIIHFDAGSLSPSMIVTTTGSSPALTGTAATGGTVGTYSYQWQQSFDEVNWTNCAGATSISFTPSSVSRTTYYRRLATSGYESKFSNVDAPQNVIKVKVLGTTGLIAPTASTQSNSDPSLSPAQINSYTLPSISDSKINYVRSWDIIKQGVTTVAAAKALSTVSDYKQATTYFDDLGREIQTVAKQATPDNMDLISVVNYDILGREVQKYLPYFDSTNTGNFKTNSATKQPAFYDYLYGGTEGFYYNNTVYEKSPNNRAWKTTAPGNSWSGNNVGVRMDYTFNSSLDSVRIWTVGTNLTDVPSTTTSYAPGMLALVATTDEHENKVMEFKDKEGKVILKKVQLSDSLTNGYNGWLSTYYVYDVFNRLRWVLQPKAVEYANGNAWVLNATVQDELCFQYNYDANGNMITKKVPGAGRVDLVYDARDRMIMSQDSVLRFSGQWNVSVYDSLNRPIKSALWTNSSTRTSHQIIGPIQCELSHIEWYLCGTN